MVWRRFREVSGRFHAGFGEVSGGFGRGETRLVSGRFHPPPSETIT